MNIIDNPILRTKFIDQFHIKDCFDSVSDLSFELVGYTKDEYIIREGEEADCLLFLLVGRVKCFACSKKRDFGMYYMNKGLIGDAEFVTGREATRTIQASDSVLCLKLEAWQIRHKLMSDMTFLRYLNQQLAEKLTLSEATPKDMGAELTAEDRLYDYLKLTADDNRVSQTLGEISETMGISYRHLIRMMNALCESGKLRHGKRKGAYFIA